MRTEIKQIIEKPIAKPADVMRFIWDCIDTLQLSFHPDTNFFEYESSYKSSGSLTAPNAATFNKEEAKALNLALSKCAAVCKQDHFDIYELSLTLTNIYLNEEIQTSKDDFFPNGFTAWYETHHEIVNYIHDTVDSSGTIANHYMSAQGTGGLYEFANACTNEFETLNKGREWDGEFFDEVEVFMNKKNSEFTDENQKQPLPINDIILLVDGDKCTLSEFIQTNVLDKDVNHISKNDLIRVLRLNVDDRAFIGTTEVKRIA